MRKPPSACARSVHRPHAAAESPSRCSLCKRKGCRTFDHHRPLLLQPAASDLNLSPIDLRFLRYAVVQLSERVSYNLKKLRAVGLAMRLTHLPSPYATTGAITAYRPLAWNGQQSSWPRLRTHTYGHVRSVGVENWLCQRWLGNGRAVRPYSRRLDAWSTSAGLPGRTLLTDVGQRCGCSVLFVAHLPTELVEVAADRMALPFATELCDQAVAHAGIKRRESHMHLRQRAHLWLHTCTLQAICVDGNNLVVVLMHEQQSIIAGTGRA